MSDIAVSEKLDKRLLKAGFKMQQPLLALRLIEARRQLAAPFVYLRARARARPIVAGSNWADFISARNGYRLFGADQFAELPAIVAAGQAVFDGHSEELAKDHNKKYFFNLMAASDVTRFPVLADFALSRPMVEAAAGYLGQAPRLHSMGIFYSSVNDTVSGSQMYHVDGDCLAQVKCFVNIWPVERGGGEFTFVTKADTDARMRNGGLLKSLDDAAVGAAVPQERYVHVFGPAGAGVLVDTSRCMHQGSRARERPRLVFQFQYVTRPDALLHQLGRTNVPGGHLHATRELLAGVPLSNPNAFEFVD
jgi:hypothetical protein